jgi:2-C-methyl-D-erythritol 4-phosphate cytidylyltransferase
VWSIVVAAGGGTRFGAPKQFARLGSATVLDRSLGTARRSSDGVVVVLPANARWDAPDAVATVVGGATRSASVRAGLALVPSDAHIVLVHDAARPLASPLLFRAVIDAVAAGADAAIPALAIGDTIKQVDNDRVVTTIDRTNLVAVQTPQAFTAVALRAAHASNADGTDDAALVEASGGTVVVVVGERRNFKITVAEDLEVAAALLETT